MKSGLGVLMSVSGWLLLLYDAFEGSIGITDSFSGALLWIVYLIISSLIGAVLMEK